MPSRKSADPDFRAIDYIPSPQIRAASWLGIPLPFGVRVRSAKALGLAVKLRLDAADMQKHEKNEQGSQDEPRKMSAYHHDGYRGQDEEKCAHQEGGRTFARSPLAGFASNETPTSRIARLFSGYWVHRSSPWMSWYRAS